MTGIVGIVIGLIALIIAFVIEGGNPLALLSGTSAIIVFGGTISIIVTAFPISLVKKIGAILKVAFTAKDRDLVSRIIYFKDLAFKTRKNGLLSIEGEISADPSMDPFVKKGLQMIVDGVEPQSVKSILELEAELTSERHKEGAEVFEAAGGFAPTLGIIGTVMGLVNVLGNLNNSAELGGKIATAFIATLYGVSSANIIWLPIGSRLKAINRQEMNEKSLIIEAILSIQEGANPNTIAEKLKSFLSKDELVRYESMDKKVE